MNQFETNPQPKQFYTTTPPISEVSRDDRPTTPDIFTRTFCGEKPIMAFYNEQPIENPNNSPIDPSPLPLLACLLIIYIYKCRKNIFAKILAYLKKKH